MSKAKLAIGLVVFTVAACSSQPVQDDPLRNTKKLVKEGHATLYQNGAFQVPMTTIMLIPPGPDAFSLASELAGMRAAQSFRLSLQHAREAAGLARAGVQKSVDLAKDIHQGTQEVADAGRETAKVGVKVLAAAPGLAGEVIEGSVSLAGEAAKETYRAGAHMAEDSLDSAADISSSSTVLAGDAARWGVRSAGETASGSLERSGRMLSTAGDRFIKGYAALPDTLVGRVRKVGDSASFAHFVRGFEHANDWRGQTSDRFADIVVDTGSDYSDSVGGSFARAKQELTEGAERTGYTLAALKSLRWVLQGVFWDGLIKPVGKITGASIGYITVNSLVFPALVVVNEGVAVANVAVQLTWNSAAAAYEIVAPTATAAVAGVFSVTQAVAGQALAAGELALGATSAAVIFGAGQAGAAVTAVGGYSAGKTVQYVGAPLAALGTAAIGSAFGVVAGGTIATIGAGTTLAGVGSEAVSQVAGNTLAVSTLVIGSSVSVAAGAGLAAYELSKAVVVPTGYELGAGLVLSYGTLSQLGAQTLLAASDAAYLVLSLEGQRWVLYAVRGDLDSGENLPAGTVLDLKAMQQAGETFYQVPVSEQELQKAVEAVYPELPVLAPIQSSND